MQTASFIAFLVLATMPSIVRLQAAAPLQGPPSHQREAQPVAGLLDINTATIEQLEALPGFGREYARRVIAARPYMLKNQLVTRGVIPLNAYSKVAPLIVAHQVRR